jgi:sortase A
MRTALRIFGVTLMVVGLVWGFTFARGLLFPPENAEAAAQVTELEETWVRQGPSDHKGEPKEYVRPIMRIPRLGANWEQPVVKGVGLPALALGVGYFPGAAKPGEVGNFAVAGHRCCAATHGEPFAYLDSIQDGDLVIVETRTTVYTYQMRDWYLVDPSEVDVIAPVPGQPDATPHKARITLVTCNPRWGSTERLITHGVLIKVSEK